MRDGAVLTGWRRILVATDFSSPSRLALRSAERLAGGSDTEIVLVHVAEHVAGAPSVALPDELDSAGHSDAESWAKAEWWIEEARVALRALALQARSRGARIAEIEVRHGTPWVEIIEGARRHEADLVILGNSGRGRVHRLLLGSTAEQVVRRSPVPVLVVRSRAVAALRRVLVPVALDEGSRAAVAFAAEHLPGDVEIETFHAVPPITAVEPWAPLPQPETDEVTAELRGFLDVADSPRIGMRVIVESDPARAILDRAREWQADLILMSTHGRIGLVHVLLGSVAERVARCADRPVLVLPASRGPRAAPRPDLEWAREFCPIGAGELVFR